MHIAHCTTIIALSSGSALHSFYLCFTGNVFYISRMHGSSEAA